MSQVQARPSQRTLGALQIAILALVVITALVHLQRGIGMSMFMYGGDARGGFPAGGAGRPQGGPTGGFGVMQLLPLPLPILFLLNGTGYLVLGAALYLPALARYRQIVRWLLILFAATTFVLYFLINGVRLNPIGLIDKAAELALIVLLFIDGRQATRAVRAEIAAT